MRKQAYERYLSDSSACSASSDALASNVLINAKNVRIVDHLSNLYAHLLENDYIDCIVGFDENIDHIFSRDVLKKIRDHDLSWQEMVPRSVAEAIKRRALFGHATDQGTPMDPRDTPVGWTVSRCLEVRNRLVSDRLPTSN
jgi:hypothetical protein